MKITKILLAAASAVILTLGSAVSVSAASEKFIVDNADVVSDSYEDKINDELKAIGEKYDCDVVIFTEYEKSVSDARSRADKLYDEYGFDSDGIIFYLNTDSRGWAISTGGSCISAFTDDGIDYITDKFLPSLNKNNYEKAFSTYADLCDDFLKQAESGKPYGGSNMPKKPFNFLLYGVIALVIGLVVAGIAVGSMLAQLKSVQRRNEASDYQKPNSLKINESRELFLYKKVDKRRREQNNNNSTTTRSSDGSRHGGDSGSF